MADWPTYVYRNWRYCLKITYIDSILPQYWRYHWYSFQRQQKFKELVTSYICCNLYAIINNIYRYRNNILSLRYNFIRILRCVHLNRWWRLNIATKYVAEEKWKMSQPIRGRDSHSFFICPKNTNIGIGIWFLASCKVSSYSVQHFGEVKNVKRTYELILTTHYHNSALEPSVKCTKMSQPIRCQDMLSDRQKYLAEGIKFCQVSSYSVQRS